MVTPRRLPLEQHVTESRKLVMDYVVRIQVQAIIDPGMGGVARAMTNLLTSWVSGQPNVDPRSVRFRIED